MQLALFENFQAYVDLFTLYMAIVQKLCTTSRSDGLPNSDHNNILAFLLGAPI